MISYYVEFFHEEKSIHSFKIEAKNAEDLESRIRGIIQSSPWKYYGDILYKYSSYEN